MKGLISNAYAQQAPAPSAPGAAGQPSPMASMIPFVLIFFVFYFLMIRPQKKKLQQEQEFLNSIQKGDEIFTKSGLIGTISGLTEKVCTLEIAEGVRIKILRSQIGGLARKIFQPAEAKK